MAPYKIDNFNFEILYLNYIQSINFQIKTKK
jgi:hypothetical protein